MKLNKKYKVLQCDGGGMKGTIFLQFLVALEKETGVLIPNMFDAFVGTSTGGISAAFFAMGMSAKQVLEFYEKHGKGIFNKKWFWLMREVKYKRAYIDKLCNKLLTKKLKDIEKKGKLFFCTGVEMQRKENGKMVAGDKETHFFKSYKKKYKEETLATAVKRTFSAPTYFEAQKDAKGTWWDGGVGISNCTLEESIYEMEEIKKLKKSEYFILSCGCGLTKKKYRGGGLINQIKDFAELARAQATSKQIKDATRNKVDFIRADVDIKGEHDCLDGANLISQFKVYGNKMTSKFLGNVIKAIKK